MDQALITAITPFDSCVSYAPDMKRNHGCVQASRLEKEVTGFMQKNKVLF